MDGEQLVTGDELIQQLAYYKWEKEGRPLGRDLEFWTDAERSLADPRPARTIGVREWFTRRLERLDATTRPLFEHPALKHPLVIGLILMALGGYWLKSWEQDRANRIAKQTKNAERERAIRDLMREKSVDFIQDVAPVLNRMVSSLYKWVRGPKDEGSLEEHEKLAGELYYRRFSVKLNSEIYLKPHGLDFNEDYRALMIESGTTRYIIASAQTAGELGVSKVNRALSAQVDRLFTAWKADDPELALEKVDDNNPDLDGTIKEWADYTKHPNDKELRILYGHVITMTNLYYKRSQFILSRALSACLEGD